MAFGFRIRFFAPPGTSVDAEAGNVTFALPDAPEPIILRQHAPHSNALPIDPVVFTVDADGFSSEAAARAFGTALKVSLAVYSARHRLGFDMGQDRATSSLAKSVRDEIRRNTGTDVRPVVHGLDVYDTSNEIQRFSVHGRGSVVRAIRDLPVHLEQEFRPRQLPIKLALALELYNTCAYEMDAEARFLSLVTVVEVMAHRKRRARPIVAFLDERISELRGAALTDAERETLRDGLGNLKKQAISEACQQLIAAAGADPDLFNRCYKARSELLHDGVSASYPDLPRQPQLLDELVHAVLMHQLDAAG